MANGKRHNLPSMANPNEPHQSPNHPPRPQPPQQQPLHQSDAVEEDDNVKQLQECSSLYLSLQDCLVNSNRNWKSCQFEVQALKTCHEKKNNKR